MTRSSRVAAPSRPEGPIGAGEFVQIHGFVAPDRCRDWTRRILADRAHWRPAAGGTWIYGLAWYVLLEAGDLHVYHRDAARERRRLRRRLPGFVTAMRGAADHLLGPAGERGLPTRARSENLGDFWCDSGLHVGGTFGGGVPHADYEGLSPYPELLFDRETRAFSAVLSVSQPEEGGGLAVWGRRRLAHLPADLERAPRFELDYPVGTLTLLDSFLYHQVLAAKKRRRPRITGVMHFLFRPRPEPHWEYWF